MKQTTTKVVSPKKSLGQNFLKDTKTLKHITEQARQIALPVLEVGPGRGALTRFLLDAGLAVVAIEKDHRLISVLQEAFTEELARKQLVLIEGDALEVNPADFGYTDGTFQVVANLPYYITGHYLRTTLESEVCPRAMTLMLQKEVVDRITARDGKESVLSISVKAFGTPIKLCNVDKKYFTPVPRVDSAVLHIADISRQKFEESAVRVEDFFTAVRMGFSSKRKMLKNNLAPLLEKREIDFRDIAQAIEKPETVRAENLEVGDWFTTARLRA